MCTVIVIVTKEIKSVAAEIDGDMHIATDISKCSKLTDFFAYSKRRCTEL